jgi:integrase/recombinase XerC
MFLNVRGGAITSAAISKKFNRASKELKSKGLLQKSISAHRFRHGCAYSILKSEYGNDLNEKLVVCQANLGHASIRTTEIYTALPAPVLAKLRSPRDADGIQHKRYMEADYIFWKTFKKQSDHTEKRGHYKLKK